MALARRVLPGFGCFRCGERFNYRDETPFKISIGSDVVSSRCYCENCFRKLFGDKLTKELNDELDFF